MSNKKNSERKKIKKSIIENAEIKLTLNLEVNEG